MIKTKVIAVLALTVVMLAAMAGQVVGWGGWIDPTDSGGITTTVFIDGESVYATGYVNNDPDTNGKVDVYVTVDAEWTNDDNIAFTKEVILHLPDVPNSDISGSLYLGKVGSNLGEIPFPGTYDIAVDLDGDGVYESGAGTDEDFANNVPFGCKAFTTEVPEFATIALPVVSVLGLLLFFNRRKHKKE